jgi:hypothetical protein
MLAFTVQMPFLYYCDIYYGGIASIRCTAGAREPYLKYRFATLQ